MNRYKIKKVNEHINWSQIESLEMTYRYIQTPEDIRAFAQICYNTEGIQLHLWSKNDDVRAVDRRHFVGAMHGRTGEYRHGKTVCGA